VVVPGQPPVTYELHDVVLMAVDDPKMGTKLSDVDQGIRLLEMFPSGQTEGTITDVDKDDWQKVADILKAPTQGYKPAVARKVRPIIAAWLDAPTTRPEPEAPAEPAEEPPAEEPPVES